MNDSNKRKAIKQQNGQTHRKVFDNKLINFDFPNGNLL